MKVTVIILYKLIQKLGYKKKNIYIKLTQVNDIESRNHITYLEKSY